MVISTNNIERKLRLFWLFAKKHEATDLRVGNTDVKDALVHVVFWLEMITKSLLSALNGNPGPLDKTDKTYHEINSFALQKYRSVSIYDLCKHLFNAQKQFVMLIKDPRLQNKLVKIIPGKPRMNPEKIISFLEKHLREHMMRINDILHERQSRQYKF